MRKVRSRMLFAAGTPLALAAGILANDQKSTVGAGIPPAALAYCGGRLGARTCLVVSTDGQGDGNRLDT